MLRSDAQRGSRARFDETVRRYCGCSRNAEYRLTRAMIDSSSASARDRSSVVIVEGLAFKARTLSSISSMSARRTRFALRSPACSEVEMTSSPETVEYQSREIEVPRGCSNIPRFAGAARRFEPPVDGYAAGPWSRAQPSAARTARCQPT